MKNIKFCILIKNKLITHFRKFRLIEILYLYLFIIFYACVNSHSVLSQILETRKKRVLNDYSNLKKFQKF